MNLTYILDFDSTLVSVESLDELARMVMTGTDAKQKMAHFTELTNQCVDGRLTIDESLQRRLALLNVTRDDVKRFAEELKDAITDSALECEDWFSDNADAIYVVSHGFLDYILPVTDELGIPRAHVYANKFVYDGKGKVIGFDDSLYVARPGGKVLQVADLELPRPLIMIGDGMSDYEVRAKDEVNEFWAFTQHVARPGVVERADRVLTSFEELEELAELIG